MNVQLKTEDVRIELGNKGILLKIQGTDKKHRGDLRIGRSTVVWMAGKTQEANGKHIKLERLIELLDGQ